MNQEMQEDSMKTEWGIMFKPRSEEEEIFRVNIMEHHSLIQIVLRTLLKMVSGCS